MMASSPALLLGFVLVAAPADDASPRQRVAVAGLVVEGRAAPTEAQGVEAQIGAALGRGRYEIVALQDGCADAECWRAAEVLFVVRPTLRREASDHAIAITIIDVRDGSIVSEASDTCDLCGRSELVDLAGDLGEKTRRRLDQLAGEPGVFALSSSPRGATVSVDGEVVGTTPLQHELAPGRHEIRVELDGHQTVVRTTEVVGGTREAVKFELVPRPTAGTQAPEIDDGARRRDRTFVGAGAGLLVAGLGSVGVGAALVAIHARPIERDCATTNVDPDGDCRFLHNTRGGGIAALAVGGAAVVAGAVLLGLGLRHRGSKVRGSASRRSIALEVRF
jgi:hypothetical protein